MTRLALLLVGLLVAAGCGSASGSTLAGGGPSGIAGQAVVIVCGGPASEQGCPRHPVLATIDVLRMPSGRRIATVHTDKGGHFRFDLPPGTYQLRAHASSASILAPTVTTQVLPHQVKRATITFAPRHPLPVAPGTASG